MPLSLQEVDPDVDNDDQLFGDIYIDDDGVGGGADRGGGRRPRQPAQLLRVCPALYSAAGALSHGLRWTEEESYLQNMNL